MMRLRSEQLVDDPALLERVRQACARAGWTNIEPAVVTKPVPLFGIRNGRLSVPVRMGELLTDPELDAMVGFAYAHQPKVTQRAAVRLYGPWLAALLIVSVVSGATAQPWFGLVGLAMLIWYPFAARKGLASGLAARLAAPVFLSRGGDAEALLAALCKVDSECIHLGYRSAMGQYRGVIRAVADAAQISPERLRAIGEAAGANPLLTGP